jgi:thymidylate synthase
MKQYLELLQHIVDNGIEKESGRANMPNTIGVSFGFIQHNLANGFPLLTTKKMFWKGIIHELLWFLKGDTNIKYLVENNVHIWDQDAYRWYKRTYDNKYLNDSYLLSFEDFIRNIKEGKNLQPFHYDPKYTLGDLGKVYGYQWRNQNGVDQVAEVLNGLQTNPYSRYHIIDAWNKADFKDMALPPCHLLYQFIVRPLNIGERNVLYAKIVNSNGVTNPYFPSDLDKFNVPKFYLDLNMYQRSCDTFLGVPFNIASMALLSILFSKACNMVPGTINWIGGDTHLYATHLEQAKEQLTREPLQLPQMEILKDIHTMEDIENLSIDDFKLVGYTSHPAIKAELSTGLKL